MAEDYVTAWSKRGKQRHLVMVKVLHGYQAVCGINIDRTTLTTEPLHPIEARKRTTCQRCAASAH